MRNQILAAIATVAFAIPVLTQGKGTRAKQFTTTEKLWKVECTGIGGWGAASQAARVSSILRKAKCIKNLTLDTTGIGYFELKGSKVPEMAVLNNFLVKKSSAVFRPRIKKLVEVDVTKPEVIYEVSIAGLGWMGSAVETRDVLSKLDAVIRVHPNGLNGKAKVFISDKTKVNREIIEEALSKTKKLRFRKMKRVRS